MFIYSKNIIRFAQEIKTAAKTILAKEISLKVIGDRFHDRPQRASYPIKVVIYNNKNMLGYFDPNFYELGFHERLMHTTKEQLHNIIRHELAHYITYIEDGEPAQPHSTSFRDFCRRLGWGEEVYLASTTLENGNDILREESTILRKIQKLMALSTSSNPNEAEQAMIKAQQLLLKHNIEANYLESHNDETVILKRILKQKKENAKMRAIAIILETFFVSTVYNRGGDHIYLEIMGNFFNVEIAEHVANVLNDEMDKLWDQAKRQSNLSGMIAKNSFLLGLAKGYCNKIAALKNEYGTDVCRALMAIEGKLAEAKEMVYPRLSTTRRGGSHCSTSAAVGEQMGRQLHINPALNKATKQSLLLLG